MRAHERKTPALSPARCAKPGRRGSSCLTCPRCSTQKDADSLGSAWASSEIFGYDYFGPAAPSGGHTLNASRYFSWLPLATAAQDQSVDGYAVYNG